MAAPTRTRFEREQDLDRIAELYLQGKTQAEIAKVLAGERAYGVTQQTISRDLKTLQRRWQTAAVAKLDDRKAHELAKIDALERTYWAAWERSCEPRTISSAEESVGPSGRGSETESKTQKKTALRKEQRDGNPAFLAGVLECIRRRCKLLGLDAPEKRELTGQDGKDLIPASEPVSHLTDEELQQMREIHERANARRDQQRAGEAATA